MARPLRVALAIVAIAAVGIAAGCGADDDDDQGATTAPPATTAPATTAPATTPPAAGAPIEVDADPDGALAFVQTTLSAPAGENSFVFTNTSMVPHNFAIKGNEVDTPPTETISGGQSANLTVTLTPGTYTFYCELPGHEAGGMTGTLTVE